MGDLIHGPWKAVDRPKPVSDAAPAQLPDFCTRCGHTLTGESRAEGKACPICGHLNSHASLAADY